MKRRRVKITGIGPVTPAGIGREDFWRGILEPVSRVRKLEKVAAEYGAFAAAYVEPFNIVDYVERGKLPKGVARHSCLAIAAAKLALEDSGIGSRELHEARTAVVTGSAIMDFGGIISSMDGVRDRGLRAAQPRVLNAIGIGSAASAVSKVFEITGRTVAVSNQCISGMDAVGYAAAMVASGEIDIAICGGTDAPLHRFPLIELRAAGLTPATSENPEKLSRPFDMWRTTGVVSEGACLLVLEPESSPRSGYGFISGYACANDDGDDLCGGLIGSGKSALGEARLRLQDVDVINAWGPGHREVDRAEAVAMQRLFGKGLAEVAVVSIKGAIGMPLGAAPAMQIASAALAVHHGVLPPTVNWEHPDPECPLNLSNHVRLIDHTHTLINAHGFGAVNSSMVVSRC